MRAILPLALATALLTFAPAASAGCTDVVPGVWTCDDDRDGEVDGAGVTLAPVDGVSAHAGGGYVDFGTVRIAIAGGNANAATPAGPVMARALAWCFDLDQEPTTCENTLALGVVHADTEPADAQATLITWDTGRYAISQNTVVVSAAGIRAGGVLYAFCTQDASPDGCSSLLSSNNIVAQTPAGTRSALLFAYGAGGSTYVCAVAVVGACQAVPVSV